MYIIPAIDLRGGKCVRLHQGQADEQVVFGEQPAKMAEKFQKAGAKRLHVVDLDGAFDGVPINTDQFAKIREKFGGIIEFGGGIRTEQDVDKMLGFGADKIILGTMACQSEEFILKCIKRFGDVFIAGIDARNGFVAIKGWVETTNIKAEDLGVRMQTLGISEIIFTDILRDGTLVGPNIESLKIMADSIKIPVIASGGISCEKDVADIVKIENSGVTGIIIGKALYTGKIDLEEVIKCWQKG